jgi:hypothetical protein
VGELDVPMAVAVGVGVARHAVLAGTQHPVGDPVAVGIEQSVVEAPVAVEVDQRTAGVLRAVEPEPAQLPAPPRLPPTSPFRRR